MITITCWIVSIPRRDACRSSFGAMAEATGAFAGGVALWTPAPQAARARPTASTAQRAGPRCRGRLGLVTECLNAGIAGCSANRTLLSSAPGRLSFLRHAAYAARVRVPTLASRKALQAGFGPVLGAAPLGSGLPMSYQNVRGSR